MLPLNAKQITEIISFQTLTVIKIHVMKEFYKYTKITSTQKYEN